MRLTRAERDDAVAELRWDACIPPPGSSVAGPPGPRAEIDRFVRRGGRLFHLVDAVPLRALDEAQREAGRWAVTRYVLP